MESISPVILMIGIATLAAGCASTDEWQDWRGHPTHFASGQHGSFSLQNNKDGSNPRVSRLDIEAAKTEKWWGKVITVKPEQIVVGILRHPPPELDAAAALEEQPVPIRGERVQIGAPSTVAAAMGQDEAAELRIDRHAERSSGPGRTLLS